MSRAGRHGGNLRALAGCCGRDPRAILDFSANLNPLGPPAWLRTVVDNHLEDVQVYPDPESTDLVHAIARRYRVGREEVAVGNGSAELLVFLPLVLSARRALIPGPAYVDYQSAAAHAGCEVELVPMAADRDFAPDLDEVEKRMRPGDLVFLGRPNNPTGRGCDGESLRRLAVASPRITFVADEAFADFAEGFDSLTQRRPPNVVVLRSFTKFYAIPGLRLGCLFASPGLAFRVRDRLPPWSVNALAQAVGCAAVEDTSDYARRTLQVVADERRWLCQALAGIEGLRPLPSQANFLLVRIERPGLDAAELAARTLEQGIAVRVCDNYEGLDERYFRVAVRRHADNVALCRTLMSALGLGPPVLRDGRGSS